MISLYSLEDINQGNNSAGREESHGVPFLPPGSGGDEEGRGPGVTFPASLTL